MKTSFNEGFEESSCRVIAETLLVLVLSLYCDSVYRSFQPRFFLKHKLHSCQSIVINLQEDKLEDANDTPDRFSSLANVTKVKNTGSKLENEYIEDINNKTDKAVNRSVPASYNVKVEDNFNVVEIVKTIIAVSGADVVVLLIQSQYWMRCV